MKYKSELDKDLIKRAGADISLIMAELKKALTLQTETYQGRPTIQKVPIVITYIKYKNVKPDCFEYSYGFNYESEPELGRETYDDSFPAHTAYIVAVLQPVI